MDSQVVMTVLTPGVLSLPVDAGRKGTQSSGLTTGGPLDLQSFYWANRLCHNPDSATCIEITLGGLKLRIETSCHIAVTGAEMPVMVNGIQQPRWQTLAVHPGDEVELGQAQKGMRCYLGVAGGFATPKQFGSCSAVPREKLGGTHLDGSGLQVKEGLKGNPANTGKKLKLPEVFIPVFPDNIRLRFIPGYQHKNFQSVEKTRFLVSEYQVTERMDRMGLCLHGPTISCLESSLKSEGICLGAIQIPPDGQPIVMLNDRQTIGGYPKLGSLLSLDCHVLSQARPGTKVSFTEIDMYSAHNLLLLDKHKKRPDVLIDGVAG